MGRGVAVFFVVVVLASIAIASCSEDHPSGTDAGPDVTAVPDVTSVDTGVDAGKDVGVDADLDAGIDADAGCDASFTDDPRNCGRCGHDCVGGGCEAGVCQPWTIIDTPASDIVSDNTKVYWIYGGGFPGSLSSCPRNGCDAGAPLATNLLFPVKLAQDSTRLYYTNYVDDGGVLATCAKGGCDASPTILSTPHKYPAWLVVDSTSVAWNVGNFDLWRCSLPNCPDGGSSVSGMTVAQGLAQDATNIYWSESYTNIVTCQKSNCGSTKKTIATGLNGISNLAVYGTNVYAVESNSTGKIVSCPTTSTTCTPVTVAQNLVGPADLEVDATGVYFISYGTTATTDSSLSHCPLSGCSSTPTVLMSKMYITSGIALDNDAVYVTTEGSGIRGIAKP